MKKQRILAFLLAAALVLALAAGCGTTTDPPAETSPAVSGSETPQASPEASAPEAEAPSEAPSEVPPEETGAPPQNIDSSSLYPIFDELTTFTAFLNCSPTVANFIGEGAEFENYRAITEAEKYTNVHLDVNWSDPQTYTEKLNLMFVGGDLADIIRDATATYTGGAEMMIDDGLTVDLTPYFKEYAPEYYNLLESNASFKKAVSSATGVTCSIFGYTENPAYFQGPVVRKDFLDDLNMDIPVTVAELYAAASAMKTELGVEFPIVGPSFTMAAYDGDAGGVTGSIATSEIIYAAIDGELVPEITLQSHYDWVVEMRKWNSEGLFFDQWYNSTLPFYDDYVLTDRMAFVTAVEGMTSTATRSKALDPNKCLIYPMANVVLNEGDTIKNGDNTRGGRGNGDWCITTNSSEYIPQLVSYANWFFTEDGIMLSNFGVEGEMHEYDAEGNIQFTDFILSDPKGYGTVIRYIFANSTTNPFYYLYSLTELVYDNEIEATCYDTWLSNMTGEYYVGTVRMLPEESERYYLLQSDISTVIEEKETKFIVGDLDLSEWDAFIDSLYELGLEEMREIYEVAYIRTNS